MATKPKRVRFDTDLDDFNTLLLGIMGKSSALITRTTHLTACQVTYRLARARALLGMTTPLRTAYRNGEGLYERPLRQAMERTVAPLVRQELRTAGTTKRRRRGSS